MRFLRRWRWPLLLVLVVAARAALPGLVRSQIETRASQAIGAPVHVGDVDLGLLSGHVALEDVTVRAKDAAPDEEALIAWKRFAVTLRWLPFLWKTVRFATIELVEPQVALDRLQSGDVNLMALVPKSEAGEPAAEGAAEEPSGWKAGVDYFGLFRGGVRFRDFLIPGAEPLALSLESIEVRDIALEPDVYGGPGGVRFVARLEGGAVRTRARLVPGPEGVGVDVTIAATKLPLRRSRVYVPGVAWSDLTGLVSFGLRYRLEPGGRNELSGKVGLDDLTVFVAGLEEPALAWKRLAVELDRVDLAGHDARVASVALDGVVLPVRPKGPEILPVLAAARAAEAAAESAPAPGAGKAPADAEAAKPWTWSIASIALSDGRTRLLGDAAPLEVGTTVRVKDVADPEAHPSPVEVDLAVGEGSLGVRGELRRSPLGFAGRLTSAALDVPKLVDAVQALPPQILQTAKLDADLEVALGSSAPTAGDVRIAGTTTVSDLWIAAADATAFATGAKRLAVAVNEVTVPGALAPSPAGDRPLAVTLGPVAVDGLYSRLTRTAEGIALPDLTGEARPAEGAAPPPAEAAPAGPPPSVAIERVTIAKGRIDVMDRTVKPFYWSALDPVDVDLERVRLPDLEIGSVKAHIGTDEKGTIDVTGGFTSKSQLEVVVKNLALMPFNPYVTSASPYSVSRGALFVTVKAAKDGPAYDTTTWLTLSDFDLASRSGQHVVLEQLGIPLTVAIALLRDWKGNIDLTVPVQVDEKGSAVGLGSVVGQALVRALVGTLMSPLKLVGAVLPTGGSGATSLAPQPVRFLAGASALDETGTEQIGHLATFLASRPGVGVTLAAPPTTADVRGLRERALLERLGPRTGIIGTIRSVGARGRIVDALTARSQGEEGPLEPDDEQALDEYLEDVASPSPEALRKLGEERLAIVETTLREKYGIGENQIARGAEEGGEPGEGEPAVRVELGSAR